MSELPQDIYDVNTPTKADPTSGRPQSLWAGLDPDVISKMMLAGQKQQPVTQNQALPPNYYYPNIAAQDVVVGTTQGQLGSLNLIAPASPLMPYGVWEEQARAKVTALKAMKEAEFAQVPYDYLQIEDPSKAAWFVDFQIQGVRDLDRHYTELGGGSRANGLKLMKRDRALEEYSAKVHAFKSSQDATFRIASDMLTLDIKGGLNETYVAPVVADASRAYLAERYEGMSIDEAMKREAQLRGGLEKAVGIEMSTKTFVDAKKNTLIENEFVQNMVRLTPDGKKLTGINSNISSLYQRKQEKGTFALGVEDLSKVMVGWDKLSPEDRGRVLEGYGQFLEEVNNEYQLHYGRTQEHARPTFGEYTTAILGRMTGEQTFKETTVTRSMEMDMLRERERLSKSTVTVTPKSSITIGNNAREVKDMVTFTKPTTPIAIGTGFTLGFDMKTGVPLNLAGQQVAFTGYYTDPVTQLVYATISTLDGSSLGEKETTQLKTGEWKQDVESATREKTKGQKYTRSYAVVMTEAMANTISDGLSNGKVEVKNSDGSPSSIPVNSREDLKIIEEEMWNKRLRTAGGFPDVNIDAFEKDYKEIRWGGYEERQQN